tara:strand:- start:173 stop:1438 length:1266 start_codon:yes stop_codon:yes gene_type:complete
MKYIYKHGNQYWYQRAVPSKLLKLLGRKTLKISLKTNKVPTAIKRAKLQALEHKKMFKIAEDNLNKYFKNFFNKNEFDSQKYTLSFIDDFDDLVNKLFFSKKEFINILKNNKLNNASNLSLERILLDNSTNEEMSLSLLIEEYLKTINVLNDKKKLYSIKKSLSLMIDICGDKPIDSYNSNDANSFKNYFIKIDKISTGKRNQSNLQNFFSVIFQKYLIDKKNPFADLRWPNMIVKISYQKFSDEELIRIKDFCERDNSFTSSIIGIMLETGCSYSEIVGLESEDVDLNKYNPYIVIRSNSIRQVKNIYRRRTIPLVGISLSKIQKIYQINNKGFLFKEYSNALELLKFKFEKKINNKLKILSNGKTLISFKYSLIERLKSINCPESVICDLIGMAKRESFYSNDVTLDIKSSWLDQIKML